MTKTSKKAMPPKASPQTKKAIRFFKGKVPATELLETPKRERFQYRGSVKTLNDKFFDALENKQLWQVVALGLATAFVVAVLYWGFTQ